LRYACIVELEAAAIRRIASRKLLTSRLLAHPRDVEERLTSLLTSRAAIPEAGDGESDDIRAPKPI